MKKIISVALAVVLAMALTVSAFAVDAITFEKPMTMGIYIHEGSPEQKIEITGTGAYTFEVTGLDVTNAQWLVIKNIDETGWPPVVNPSAVPDGTIIRLCDVKINGEDVTFADAAYYDYEVKNNGVVEINVWNDFATGILGVSFDKESTINSITATVVFFKDAAEAAAGIIPTVPVVEEAPAEEPAPEVDEPAEDETPATEAPAETGVALAVIPAIVAMAAVVISKKR